MRIVIISDAHGGHDALGVLKGDVLIHCGDLENLFSRDGDLLDSTDAWFGRQNFDLILSTGGNHDFELEQRVRSGKRPLKNARFLQDEGIEYHGIRFWGSPWVPELEPHAFFADEDALVTAWSRVPDDVDVLITHTPPAGILDVSSRGRVLGCSHLLKAVERCRPRVHCFGHVHASAGRLVRGATTFVNASSVSSGLKITHAPIIIDL